ARVVDQRNLVDGAVAPVADWIRIELGTCEDRFDLLVPRRYTFRHIVDAAVRCAVDRVADHIGRIHRCTSSRALPRRARLCARECLGHTVRARYAASLAMSPLSVLVSSGGE